MSAMSIEPVAMSDTADKMIFEFERDFAGSLRCIPMIVRFKLDQCGVKLSLRQWSRFDREERAALVAHSCASVEDIAAYCNLLVRLIETRAQEMAVFLPVEAHPAWADTNLLPVRLVTYALDLGLQVPLLDAWRKLSSLQRFALFKLTRSGHDNDNFEPAMREFGLLTG
jgi:hypothetical protein